MIYGECSSGFRWGGLCWWWSWWYSELMIWLESWWCVPNVCFRSRWWYFYHQLYHQLGCTPVSFTRATVFKLYNINYSQNWIECSLQNISTADYFYDHNRSQFYTICGNKCLFIGASQVQGISKILYFALRKVTYVQIRSW